VPQSSPLFDGASGPTAQPPKGVTNGSASMSSSAPSLCNVSALNS